MAVIAAGALLWSLQRLNVQGETMHAPIIAAQNEGALESPAAAKPEKLPATTVPVSVTQNGPAEQEVAADIPTQENEQRSPDIGIAAFRDSIPEGGALLTGGWARPDGSHVFVLVSPKMRTDLGSDIVEISGEFFGVSPDLLTDSDLNKILEKNDRGMHLNGSTYTAGQLREFRERHDSAIGLAAPRIITRSGQNASIQIGSETENRILSVIATHNEVSGEIEVAVTAAEHE